MAMLYLRNKPIGAISRVTMPASSVTYGSGTVKSALDSMSFVEYKKANWTATATSAYAAVCSDTLTLTKGTWLIILVTPVISEDTRVLLWSYGAGQDVVRTSVGSARESASVIVTVDANTNFAARIGSSTSLTYSEITGAGLFALRIH